MSNHTNENIQTNPFNITKAVDFSDGDLVRTWVNLPGNAGPYGFVDPLAPMPLFLLGGKGVGRTHLMKYLSAPLQELRHEDDPLEGVREEGFLGIYLRCSGLNSGRFRGKGLPEEVWEDVFSYYFDLWLTQLTLETVEMVASRQLDSKLQAQLCLEATRLFDEWPLDAPSNLGGLIKGIHEFQQELDLGVNNAAVTRSLDAKIRATRGTLVFGIPRVIQANVPSLNEIQFLYLIDEFENLSEYQQMYVNTLVREKQAPTSFVVGSRTYGFRTRATYASSEENKEGSEFHLNYLDRIYLQNNDKYETFCRNLIGRRVAEAGYSVTNDEALNLDNCFFTYEQDRLALRETDFAQKRPTSERPYIQALRSKLIKFKPVGVSTERDADKIVETIGLSDFPLVEKTSVYLLYHAWADRKDVSKAAQEVSSAARAFVAGAAETPHAQKLDKFKGDLIAQMLREFHLPQRYLGFDTFMRLSAGLPRNLLILLKYTFQWAIFNGEQPFRDHPIGEKAQLQGVLEAAKWFFQDAPEAGEQSEHARAAVQRLGQFFRRLRFSDKPSESSLVTFNVNVSRLNSNAQNVLDAAHKWSLVISTPTGHKEDSGAIEPKYQLNPLLAPIWDLPISRRGSVSLSEAEGNAIFDFSASEDAFNRVLRDRLKRLEAPFGRESEDNQSALFRQ